MHEVDAGGAATLRFSAGPWWGWGVEKFCWGDLLLLILLNYE